jgi:RNA polymerase sigma-70 factor, ECF subfamily
VVVAWLYRIATNACLDHLARRSPRLLPADVAPAADPEAEPPPAASDVAWLDPYPDRLVDPHEAAAARETLEIAFVAAIQHLPPRQRAALILRDAAGFSARETARLLGTSVPAVNSALQRARDRLRDRLPSRRLEWVHSEDPTAEEREVARRYVDALERRDFSALAALVRVDARFSFPPRAVWYDGLDAFRRASDSTPRRASTCSSPPPRTCSPPSPCTCGRRASRATVRSRSRCCAWRRGASSRSSTGTGRSCSRRSDWR